MAAFKSLLYREFRLCRKDNIVRTLLIMAYTGMMWVAIFTAQKVSAGSIELIENYDVCSAISIMLSLVCAVACLGLDNVFKSDISSGWMKYSYTLPITPFMRAAVRAVRLFIITASGAIFSIINIAGFCASTGNLFSGGYITLQIAVIDLMMFIMLIMDFFVFSARDTESLQKKQTFSGLVTLVIVFAVVALFFKINGIDFRDIFDDNHLNIPSLIMSKMSGTGVFIILLLIMLFLFAADMAAVAYRMRSAEISSTVIRKNKNPSENEGVILKHNHITSGFLYKEFTQNKALIAFTAALPLGLMLLSFPMSAILSHSSEMVSNGIFEFATGKIMRYAMLAFGAVIASSILPSVFQGDDRKIWAYFIVSAPGGVKGFMYNKYVLAFAMNGLYMVACYFTETLVVTLRYAVTGNESQSMLAVFITVFYTMLFLCAFDIPFSVRYGAKKGSFIKMTALLSIIIIAVLVVSFVLPESIVQKIPEFFISIFNGNAGGTVMLLTALCPFISLAAYMLSYKISCKIFMKGVNGYDR